MIEKRNLVIAFLLVGILLIISLSSAQYTRALTQSVAPGVFVSGSGNLLAFDESICRENIGQDLIIQIAPFGCEPVVVRSDLLEEQDVTVACQLAATKINPLIDIETIKNMQFVWDVKPKEVKSVPLFFPAKAALGIRTKLNSPVLNNIGYLVVVIARQPNESAMPEFLHGNLTARVIYDVKNAFGVGNTNYYLPSLSDKEFEDRFAQFSFWNGRGYLRAESIGQDGAQISVYSSTSRPVSVGPRQIDYNRNRIATVNLKEGETSGKIYLPGLGFCLAGLDIRLNKIEAPDTRAKIKVNADIFEVANKERFLENKCRVTDLVKYGILEKVELRCQEDGGRYRNLDFSLSPKIKLSIDGTERVVGVGDWLYQHGSEDKTRSVYLGYVGSKKDSSKERDLIATLISIPKHKGNLTESEIKYVTEISEAYDISRTVTDVPIANFFINVGRSYIDGAPRQFFGWLQEGRSLTSLSTSIEAEVGGRKVKLIGFAEPVDIEIPPDGQTKEYHEKANEDYDTVVNSFSEEKHLEDESLLLGEEALYKKIILAEGVGQKRTVVELCEEFSQGYPDSTKLLAKCYDKSKLASSTITTRDVVMNGQVKRLSFEGIAEPTFDEYGVEILVNLPSGESKTFQLRKNKKIYLDDESSEFIQLRDLTENYADINIVTKREGTLESFRRSLVSSKKRLEKRTSLTSGEYTFTLGEIHLKNVAFVSVKSRIDYQESRANINFNIGIEKRKDIFGLLAPKKIKQRIAQLDKSIKQWEKINNNLGKVVSAGKTACLATGTILTIKNFVENARGKGIARQIAMRGPNGWYSRCSDKVNKGDFRSQEQCLLDNADEIDSDVDSLTKIMQDQNKLIRDDQDGCEDEKRGGILSIDRIIKTDCFTEKFSGRVKIQCESFIDSKYVDKGFFSNPDPTRSGEKIDVNKICSALVYDEKANVYTISQLRDTEYYLKVLESGEDDEIMKMARIKLYSTLKDIETNKRNADLIAQANKKAKEQNLEGLGYDPYTDASKRVAFYDGFILKTTKGDMKAGYLLKGITYNNKIYHLNLTDLGGNKYIISWVFDEEGNRIAKKGTDLIKNLYSHFEKRDKSFYQNKFLEPRVRFYESGIYKGDPAIVPFDLDNGWYVAMKQGSAIFGGLSSFDKSGRVKNFYLCNVGPDGKADFFSSIRDDTCQGIATNFFQTYGQFSGLESGQVIDLVGKAINAISDAQRAYKQGLGGRTISIQGNSVKVGEPALGIPDLQCQDFMSPSDCNIMFNMCDPFVCPSSRCDFGGAYPVKDVTQTGIFGSLMLCLPNYQEGIVIPICLQGVHSGIDGWINVEKSYLECLQHNLDTGETIGICDEIHSIYQCDFFWRQAIPLTKIAFPKLISVIFGQNVRGGGEYLWVKDAFDKAGKSADFFTQFYAKNSANAFKARSTEEAAGGAFCKSYASIVTPSGGKLLDQLTRPDSPPKFTGSFDEIPFTTVTNPPISHYKVAFRIDAGKDSGVQYRVFLRAGPGGSFYRDTSTIRIVASGFIPRGEFFAGTPDFTAPSGFQQLCINVNGQEECGFKQVSTSFAVDYIEDKYLASQADEIDISSEKECRSGSASFYSLLNPNLQSAAEELIDPQIYNRGITRICATHQPGKGTDAYADTERTRWVEVGYCDTQKIKCWLDTKSVRDVIDSPDIAKFLSEGKIATLDEAVIDDVTKNYIDILIDRENYIPEEELEGEIGKVQEETNPRKRIDLINEIIGRVFFTQERGYLHLLRGNAYASIALNLYKGFEPSDDAITVDEIFDELFKETEGILTPIFEFQDGARVDNLYYGYAKEGWFWSLDKEVWTNSRVSGFQAVPGESDSLFEEAVSDVTSFETLFEKLPPQNQDFIIKLAEKSCAEGLGLLIERTRSSDEGLFVNADLATEVTNMDHEALFSIKLEGLTSYIYTPSNVVPDANVKLYFDYENSWRWSLDNKNWMNVPEIEVRGGEFNGAKLTQGFEILSRALVGRSFQKGAEFIFGMDCDELPTLTEEPIGVEEEIVDDAVSGKTCKELIGAEIIKEARQKKAEFGINDQTVKDDTGAENFECLVLQLAMQESGLRHCATGEFEEGSLSSCLACDGDVNRILKGDEGNSQGVMQINIGEDAHGPELKRKNILVEKFEVNVNFGIDFLWSRYSTGIKQYRCPENVRSYEGWNKALRYYNGWPETSCAGNPYYVEEVTGELTTRNINIKDEVIKLFPECLAAGVVSYEPRGVVCPNDKNAECLRINVIIDSSVTGFRVMDSNRDPILDSTISVVSEDRVLSIVLTTDKLGNRVGSPRKPWALEEAIEQAEIIYERDIFQKYSENKLFIDQIYEDGLLSYPEYDDINGIGIFGWGEELFGSVLLILRDKDRAKLRIDGLLTLKDLSKFSSLSDSEKKEVFDIYYYEDELGFEGNYDFYLEIFLDDLVIEFKILEVFEPWVLERFGSVEVVFSVRDEGEIERASIIIGTGSEGYLLAFNFEKEGGDPIASKIGPGTIVHEIMHLVEIDAVIDDDGKLGNPIQSNLFDAIGLLVLFDQIGFLDTLENKENVDLRSSLDWDALSSYPKELYEEEAIARVGEYISTNCFYIGTSKYVDLSKEILSYYQPLFGEECIVLN